MTTNKTEAAIGLGVAVVALVGLQQSAIPLGRALGLSAGWTVIGVGLGAAALRPILARKV